MRRAVAHSRTYLSDCLTPVRVYSRLAARSPVGFLLESVTGGERVSRFNVYRWARDLISWTARASTARHQTNGAAPEPAVVG